MNPDTATIVYSYFFVIATILAGGGIMAKHYVSKQTEELKDQLSKIMYALYNDGKTGLINKVEELLEHQHTIKVDVAVMKARFDDANK